ncbi:MAG: hypothetical protein HQ549_03055 [Candidatus Omnitrophica bacterium]|nr:hypothetical protein [Candidatus Omnitrophota bacterium]
MEVFLGIASIFFLIFGAMLLLSPNIVERISKATNKVLFNLDDKIQSTRRPLGILLLAISIFLWYTALHK